MGCPTDYPHNWLGMKLECWMHSPWNLWIPVEVIHTYTCTIQSHSVGLSHAGSLQLKQLQAIVSDRQRGNHADMIIRWSRFSDLVM